MITAAVLAIGTSAEAGSEERTRADRSTVVQGNSEFAFDLYARVRTGDGNVCFSPYSVSNALAMTYAGARGQTATQMSRVLHFPFGGDRLHSAFATVISDLNGPSSGRKTELAVANALWPQTGFPIDPVFRAIVQKQYGGGLQPLDFATRPEKARATINGWVEQQTRDRIKDLIPEGAIGPVTRLVLTNAIYFKGDWMHAFREADTRKEAFKLSGGRDIGDVPLMHQRHVLRFLDGGDFRTLELPYRDNELSMIVLLPNLVDGLGALEQTLTPARVANWLARMTDYDVDITLPRFKVAAQFQLQEALSSLGMPLAFSSRADFSAIASTAPPLQLSAVIHKAFVEVNEKGTEAAAATAATMHLTSLQLPREPKAVFRADHPFLFVVRDNATGSLLFVGRVVNPLAS
jgi:serpin B